MRGHDSGHDESMWAVLCLLLSSTTQISHLIGYYVVYLKQIYMHYMDVDYCKYHPEGGRCCHDSIVFLLSF